MLPERVARILEEEDRARLNHRIDELINGDGFFYTRSKDDVMAIIAEIAEKAYVRGREDERYYNTGPSIDIYKRREQE